MNKIKSAGLYLSLSGLLKDLVAEGLEVLSGLGYLAVSDLLFAFGVGPLVDLVVLEGGVDEAGGLDITGLPIHQLSLVVTVKGPLRDSLEHAGRSNRPHIFEAQIVRV